MSATVMAVWIIGAVLSAGVLTRAITAVENARVAKHTGVDPRSDRELAKKVRRGERDLGRS